MADLDLDELERHLVNASRTSRLADDRGFSDAVDTLLDAAPALIAAARERDRLRALCREAAEMLARVQARDLEEWEPDELTEHWSEDLEQRLREAGGEP